MRTSGAFGDLLQALERQRQMRAAPRADDGVNLVDDHRPDGPQHLRGCARPSAAGYSDSGVVTRMCGGVRSIAARSDEVVSPVRTAAVMRGASMPSALRDAARCRAAARRGSCGCRRSAP